MNIKDAIGILTLNLPNFTDEFTGFLTATISKSYVLSSRKIKIETATAHGLANGKKLIVKGVKLKNDIESIELSDEFAVIKLKAQHDFVMQDDLTFEMDGNSDQDWNGTFDVYNVPDKMTLEIVAPSETLPVTFGNIWEERDYGGMGIVTVSGVTEKTFEYEINENDPDLPVTDTESITGIKIITGVRITGAPDPERAMEIFTKSGEEPKTWGFVMFPEEGVSKDATTASEAVGQFSGSDECRQSVMVNFDVCVIQPSSSLGAIEEISKACGEIRNALIKSITGVKSLETEADVVFKTVYNGSVMNTYNTATYIRVYSFQTVFDITIRQTADNYPLTVALRRAVFEMQTGDEDSLKVIADAKFSEE
jgi:hypothetical protein